MTHQHGNVLSIERVDLVDQEPQSQEGGYDATCAGAENQIKAFAKRTTSHRLDLPQHSERIETFGSASVE